MTQPRIHFYPLPFDDRSNRYFTLWRTALAKTGAALVEPVPKGGLLRLAFGQKGGARRALVVHWSTTLYGSRFAVKSLFLLSLNSIVLVILKARGWTIIWVLHNARAHDYPHERIDRQGRALLGRFADAIVVHQAGAVTAMRKRYPNARVEHIPHGNYVGAYGPLEADRQNARRRYGFPGSERVFLAFGMIRPYKRLEALIDAFAATEASARLWILGKGESPYVASLVARTQDPRIRIENRFVQDDEIPAVFAAASYSVFSYDESELTSGGIILSLSYGVPIVAHPAPSAEMAQEGENAFLYESPGDLGALYHRLSALPPPAPERVIRAVEGDTWDMVARRYLSLYDACHGKVA